MIPREEVSVSQKMDCSSLRPWCCHGNRCASISVFLRFVLAALSADPRSARTFLFRVPPSGVQRFSTSCADESSQLHRLPSVTPLASPSTREEQNRINNRKSEVDT